MITALDFPPLEPAEILAAEEYLLEAAEAGICGETLSFWEARRHFIVVGYGNKVTTETNQAACQELGIPILRRISGGGTVLQGPGVLNYCLVLRAPEHSPLAGISGANAFIMQRNAEALTGKLHANPGSQELALKVEVQGHTDLTLSGRKFSGNAQRRKRTHLLFHGAILLNLNFNLLDTVLPMPSLQPKYRDDRSHKDFLTQLSLPACAVREALRIAWSAVETGTLDSVVQNWRLQVEKLAAEKYTRPEWNFRV